MKPTPIPTRSWWLSPPLFWFLAGVGLLLGMAVAVLKPEWCVWWLL